MSKLLPLCTLLAIVAVSTWGRTAAAQNERAMPLNILFVNYCDGLDLQIRDRRGVAGTHTGCGFQERVSGSNFTTADGEQGVTVSYFDQTVRANLRIDVFRTGFRKGKFYVYESRNGTLQRFGDWIPKPPAP
jgi:hypothetical protein